MFGHEATQSRCSIGKYILPGAPNKPPTTGTGTTPKAGVGVGAGWTQKEEAADCREESKQISDMKTEKN